jgi:hypothetical protein
MIRIRTKFDEKHRVYTLFHAGKWVTMATGMETKDAATLYDAGLNHLQLACALRVKFPVLCKGCNKPLDGRDYRIADGCPCNSARGINHGLVPVNTCTCVVCDPEQTGSTRYPLL